MIEKIISQADLNDTQITQFISATLLSNSTQNLDNMIHSTYHRRLQQDIKIQNNYIIDQHNTNEQIFKNWGLNHTQGQNILQLLSTKQSCIFTNFTIFQSAAANSKTLQKLAMSLGMSNSQQNQLIQLHNSNLVADSLQISPTVIQTLYLTLFNNSQSSYQNKENFQEKAIKAGLSDIQTRQLFGQLFYLNATQSPYLDSSQKLEYDHQRKLASQNSLIEEKLVQMANQLGLTATQISEVKNSIQKDIIETLMNDGDQTPVNISSVLAGNSDIFTQSNKDTGSVSTNSSVIDLQNLGPSILTYILYQSQQQLKSQTVPLKNTSSTLTKKDGKINSGKQSKVQSSPPQQSQDSALISVLQQYFPQTYKTFQTTNYTASNSTNQTAELDIMLEQLNSELAQINLTQDQIVKIQKLLNFQMSSRFQMQAFESNQALDSYIQDKEYGTEKKPGVCFGFKVIENTSNDYEIELMFNDLPPSQYISIPNQKLRSADPTQKLPLINQYQYYVNNGFCHMQNWLANLILKSKTGKSDAQIVNMIVPMQIPPVVQDHFLQLMQISMTSFILLMFTPIIYRTVYRIVYEKASRAKESMRMMGMSNLAYWSSWFVYYTLINTVITTLSTVILFIRVISPQSGVFLFLIIWLYGQSLFGLILITQSLFVNPRAAAIWTTIVYFGTSIFNILVQPVDTTWSNKFIFSFLFPTVAISQTVLVLIPLDVSLGVNLTTVDFQLNNFSLQEGLICLLAANVTLISLGIYLELVLPKSFGQQIHPLFCLGFGKKITKENKKLQKNAKTNQNIELEEYVGDQFETKYLNAQCFEPVSDEIKAKERNKDFIKIADLKKQYENGTKAVDGINLKIYSDQLFVLLGHNGTGKTTTISLLTGLFKATSGSFEIFGKDAFDNSSEVRKIMGVCPQYDIHFELLTTQEHLEFFYDIKGGDPCLFIKRTEIEKLMKEVGIEDKKSTQADKLSGGNKRKLSVAIALCGGSKFVLLDEPTSGMDIQARRQLWNMLTKYKKNRIIILTTHYMDEADILGDRIGIMVNGKLTCLGTSLFLKNKFGVGYHLSLQHETKLANDRITEYLTSNLGKSIRKQYENQKETIFLIPLFYSNLFGQFFRKLDTDLHELNLSSYSISLSTLEDVFLKIGHLENPQNLIIQPDGSNFFTGNLLSEDDESIAMLDLQKYQSSCSQTDKEKCIQEFSLAKNQNDIDKSFKNQIFAVIFKRISNYRRNRSVIFNETVLPAIIMIFGILTTTFLPSFRSPSRVLSPNRLPLPQKLMVNPTFISQSAIQAKQLIGQMANLNSSFQVFYAEQNVSTTFKQFGQELYNFGHQMNSRPPYQYGSYDIFQANNSTQQYKFITWVNLTSQDATGLYPQFLYESILKQATNDSEFQFKTRLTPFPPTGLVKSIRQATNAATIVFVSAIAYGMIVTSIVSYLVTERISGLKHLQVISGMNLAAYWIGNFIFDYLKMQLPTIIAIIMLYSFDLGMNASWATFLALPFGIIPFCYFLSLLFSDDSAAQTFTMFFQFFFLGLMSTVIFALRIFPNQEVYGDFLNNFFKIIPIYSLGSSVYCDTICSQISLQRKQNNSTRIVDQNPWAVENIPSDIISLFIHFMLWTSFLFLFEYRYISFHRLKNQFGLIWQKLAINIDLRSNSALNNSVQNQEIQIHQIENKIQIVDIVQVQSLNKTYFNSRNIFCKQGSLVAVKSLQFSLQNGECFALLGVNGAGKSTIFKTLVGEVQPTSGQIKICGFDMLLEFNQAKQFIGYCPQKNLLFQSMSVEEHLYYFALLKGIPKNIRKILVEKSLKMFQLEKYRKNQTGTLSGGNQRKVCVAIALIGNPLVVLLDEPTAGMDPQSRKLVWKVVREIVKKQTSTIVFTTHSMEEAESLSTKMGIMVKGGDFKCFGAAQQIKDKFGEDYEIEIKIRTLTPDEEIDQNLNTEPFAIFNPTTEQLFLQDEFLDEFLKQELLGKLKDDPEMSLKKLHTELNLLKCVRKLCEEFLTVELLEKYGDYVRVRVQRQGKTIGSVFAMIELMKSEYFVSEYSVSQTTLEQIFQKFANMETGEKPKVFKLIEQSAMTERNLLNRLDCQVLAIEDSQ